jgi:hypothetical protein
MNTVIVTFQCLLDSAADFYIAAFSHETFLLSTLSVFKYSMPYAGLSK